MFKHLLVTEICSIVQGTREAGYNLFGKFRYDLKSSLSEVGAALVSYHKDSNVPQFCLP